MGNSWQNSQEDVLKRISSSRQKIASDQNLRRRHIIYNKYYYNGPFRVADPAYSPWRNSFVETYPPPRSPAQPLRTLKSFPLFPPTQDVAARRPPARTEGCRMAGTPTIANFNRTSGRLKVKVVNRPLDTRRSKSQTDLWTP